MWKGAKNRNGGCFMSKKMRSIEKKERREAAIKQEKRKKTFLIVLASVTLIALVGLMVMNALKKEEVPKQLSGFYSDGENVVQLYTDDSFSAMIAGVEHEGTFVIMGNPDEEDWYMFFTDEEGTEVRAILRDENLHMPEEWLADSEEEIILERQF